jgi:hypothetical protein
MKRFPSVAAACVITLVAAHGQDVRRAAVAGVFYDDDPARLAEDIRAGLDAAPEKILSGNVLGLIVPHAGYSCSGRTAALGYRQVRGRAYDAVVLLGPSHYAGFEGCSIDSRGGYETPLGTAAVAAALAAELSLRTGFGYVAAAHDREHSLEVQIPFLQTVLPGAPIVPVVMGRNSRRTVETLAEGLRRACAGRKVLIVASTDLSHQLPRSRANKVDAETIGLIRGYGLETLFGKYERGENVFCGGGAVLAAMLYARKAGGARVEVLGYSDSSRTCGPEEAVVGYMAAALVEDPERPGAAAAYFARFTADDKRELLQTARRALEAAVRNSPPPVAPTSSPVLDEPGAAFVTLTRRGALRGCVGFIEPVAPLVEAVARAAALAALVDRRFEPVAERELMGLDVEVSVLSPLVPVSNPRHIEVGRHGLVVGRGEQRGLLLPRVATDNGWDREEFLRQACLKAGLPPDAWKKGAEISVFEALVIR